MIKDNDYFRLIKVNQQKKKKKRKEKSFSFWFVCVHQ